MTNPADHPADDRPTEGSGVLSLAPDSGSSSSSVAESGGSPPAAVKSERLRSAGYAPGNYTCKCYRCGQEFDGAKRAIACLRCAEMVAVRREAVASSEAPDTPGITADKLERALAEYDRAMREEVIPAIDDDLRRQAFMATRLRLGLAPDTEIPSDQVKKGGN